MVLSLILSPLIVSLLSRSGPSYFYLFLCKTYDSLYSVFFSFPPPRFLSVDPFERYLMAMYIFFSQVRAWH